MGKSPVVSSAILPHPLRVLTSFGDLYRDNEIVKNTFHSLGINLAGYLEAILISIPLGFLIGLIPFFRGGFQRQVESIRYIPLTAVTGLFIVWFGVGTDMKVHFLAFGIMIYLLPVVIQRIDEVEDVYLKTVYTLGANAWQTIRTVYIPSVLSRLSDDIRVLTAISWTYIIVAENIDSSQGGIGALIWRVGQRQGRMDKVFALLFLIILIGVIQDRLFSRADRSLFPFKAFALRASESQGKPNTSSGQMILQFLGQVGLWILVGVYAFLAVNEWTQLFFQGRVLANLFGDTIWAVHLLFISYIGFRVYQWWSGRQSALHLPTLNRGSN
ncbi:MAG: ABC transporter permease subunit [Saprospiraceae bacterium]|nr:ABC transporter permease subunit [Saprospiraceae bacterium]